MEYFLEARARDQHLFLPMVVPTQQRNLGFLEPERQSQHLYDGLIGFAFFRRRRDRNLQSPAMDANYPLTRGARDDMDTQDCPFGCLPALEGRRQRQHKFHPFSCLVRQNGSPAALPFWRTNEVRAQFRLIIPDRMSLATSVSAATPVPSASRGIA